MKTARELPPAGGAPRGRRQRRGPKRPRAQAEAWAVARQHELGEVVNTAQQTAVARRRRWAYGLMLGTYASCFFILAIDFMPGLAAGSRVTVAAIAPALLAAGLILARTAPPDQVDRTFACTGGLAQVGHGETAPRVIPWSLLDYVAYDYRARRSGTPRPVIRAVGIDGTVITVQGGYHDDGHRLEVRYVTMMVVALRLRDVAERCAGGTPVLFGDLAVGLDGIGWSDGARWTAWRDVRSVSLTPHEIRLGTGHPSGHQVIGLSGVPDSPVAIQLVRELAGRLGIRREGGLTERPGPPPGEGPLLAARLGVLPEADVGEILGRPVELAGWASPDGFELWRYRGDGVRLRFVVVVAGRDPIVRVLYRAWGRCLGRRVAGAGQRAWLVHGQRTLIAADGRRMVKLTLSGLPPGDAPAPLIRLARLALDRLAPDRAADDVVGAR